MFPINLQLFTFQWFLSFFSLPRTIGKCFLLSEYYLQVILARLAIFRKLNTFEPFALQLRIIRVFIDTTNNIDKIKKIALTYSAFLGFIEQLIDIFIISILMILISESVDRHVQKFAVDDSRLRHLYFLLFSLQLLS